MNGIGVQPNTAYISPAPPKNQLLSPPALSQSKRKVIGLERLVLHQCTLAHGGMAFAADALPSVSCRILEAGLKI
ncbi:hypothetical protein J5N97_009890 [Dioscorea zingiberensis]|uniref:Uncharacterized protein n=1 Tax=Dioscorea zingiberensis TaxID=325984 RepID=A0A9D5CXD1_9LILI|nr:hypothetical protein J5N97_009890 [Dioscorea zingiberensis]